MFPSRDRMKFDYYDVGDDPRAWAEAEIGDDLEHDLISAGFRPIGCANAVLRLNGTNLLDQVWVARSGRVMAGVGDARAELSTLFEDGTVVKTATSFPHAWMAVGRWNLRMHPRDRHEHMLVKGRIDAVLARHLERIAIASEQSPIVPMRSMREYFAVRLRAAELRDARMHTELWLGLVLSIVLTMVVAFVINVVTTPRHPTLVLTALAVFIVWVPMLRIVRTFVAPYLMRLRPGPPPRPAAELLALAEKIPRATLSSSSSEPTR